MFLYIRLLISTKLHLKVMFFIAIALVSLFFLFTYYTLTKHEIFIIPINWPLVGMLPHLLLNLHRVHDWALDILQHTGAKTFFFKGPWFTSMELILFTLDPSNVHYIMSKNFKNFHKGAKFSEIFEILGDGIFNVDDELWSYQRRNLHSFLTHPRFNDFLVETIRRKVEVGLIPILEHACREGNVVDLENLFQRFTFDTICTFVTGHDPGCLSTELSDVPVCKALDEVEEVLLHRQVLPESIWKLQRWLGVGKEKALIKAWKIIDSFLYKALDKSMEEMSKKKENSSDMDWMSFWLREESHVDHPDKKSTNSKFSRDMFLNLIIAGRDTTSVALTWFFWLVLKNQRVQNIVREEVKSVSSQDIDKLVYLHGALCETLRLYPYVPFQLKTPLEPDLLPSGHKVDPTTQIIVPLHAMGRDKSIWGEDCLEFKPERWITERGSIKHEPSYKFFAFNAGPRTCLGKAMAFIQMKVVASSIFLHGYHLQIVDEHMVKPSPSMILHTKNGLKVKVSKLKC